jgi:hypothetical protein
MKCLSNNGICHIVCLLFSLVNHPELFPTIKCLVIIHELFINSFDIGPKTHRLKSGQVRLIYKGDKHS